jgi:putative addiction module component (TIGR02574 family)
VGMPRRVLVDTNVIIEAVRTGCWRAITGQLEIETVEACASEALAGSHSHIRGYVTVTRDELSRLQVVHAVTPAAQAAFKLTYGDADSLDQGEHDLLAFAHVDSSEERTVRSTRPAGRSGSATVSSGRWVVGGSRCSCSPIHPCCWRTRQLRLPCHTLQPSADELPLNEEQRKIVDRRLEEHRRDPSSAIPWEEVRARIVEAMAWYERSALVPSGHPRGRPWAATFRQSGEAPHRWQSLPTPISSDTWAP